MRLNKDDNEDEQRETLASVTAMIQEERSRTCRQNVVSFIISPKTLLNIKSKPHISLSRYTLHTSLAVHFPKLQHASRYLHCKQGLWHWDQHCLYAFLYTPSYAPHLLIYPPLPPGMTPPSARNPFRLLEQPCSFPPVPCCSAIQSRHLFI